MVKMPRRSNWVELRTSENKLAFRYDPRRRLIEHVSRGKKTLFDLAEMEQNLANGEAVCYTEEE